MKAFLDTHLRRFEAVRASRGKVASRLHHSRLGLTTTCGTTQVLQTVWLASERLSWSIILDRAKRAVSTLTYSIIFLYLSTSCLVKSTTVPFLHRNELANTDRIKFVVFGSCPGRCLNCCYLCTLLKCVTHSLW